MDPAVAQRMTVETRVLVCLGNPGARYRYHRHNVGFLAADYLIEHYSFEVVGKKFRSVLYKGMRGATRLLLMKPQTYMNASGEALQLLLSFYRLRPEQCMVIYDDFDLPFSTLRLRAKGSAGTHNGMKSICATLKSLSCPRLRIGVGPLPGYMDPASFVLSNFNDDEQANLEAVHEAVSVAIDTVLDKGMGRAMNEVNTRS